MREGERRWTYDTTCILPACREIFGPDTDRMRVVDRAAATDRPDRTMRELCGCLVSQFTKPPRLARLKVAAWLARTADWEKHWNALRISLWVASWRLESSGRRSPFLETLS